MKNKKTSFCVSGIIPCVLTTNICMAKDSGFCWYGRNTNIRADVLGLTEFELFIRKKNYNSLVRAQREK